ncbi:SDR family oxidoreductase [bacterium M00.F.Ca.ET.228.01.1.1]|uniref:SDR family oxidoreductase n=1 Tax=Paraburkholderia phenoliruptrix TaxID=252970 RepID=UPI00109232BD|nr:SDR family oxidoreductase [Paraburkholderia phenoliruptrix]TGP43264.1 SDR family oxidoreductase [bacterium M00.F.Ca.ET.228.01.1.1]TGS00703.1 SDR family oxidoreductase [bacterium M00.F.Ca.ET.191.01.1.1]TGU05089.1 SDR family oxidoreductase [bacterium M00.F.Ca.ET.155.01.1.1]MBW0446798.1 SDR family oxidoreductase [Paraburkholderia phenoliruptrix]MBW9099294.1 SDR family oxidoreductase [Paraburkholderia phenoliruptrix]
MLIFLTGATGFIGSALVPELINAGHEVIGMARSDAGAQALIAAGAQVHRGTLEDPDSLRDGAMKAEGVIHTAFDHDFSRFVENCEKDKRAIAALGSALAGSDRPLVITSGTGVGSGAHGEPASEDVFNASHPNPRIASEQAGNALLEEGVNVSVVRLPQVHDVFRQGLITPLITIAREKGVCAYVGEGRNRWPAGHLSDVVRLYRLAVEKRERGARYHAVGEEGVSSREIAEALGRGLNLPVVSIPPQEAAAHFGWLAMFTGLDMPASSALTQSRLGWRPTGRTLIADLDEARYAQ